jgi:ribosomal protein S27AE
MPENTHEPKATPEEIAWAAGLFEGEGCISAASDGRPRMTLLMTDRETVERFGRVIGRGTVQKEVRGKIPAHHKDKWRWYLGRRDDVGEVWALLSPWLGTRRRERGAELFRAYDQVRAPLLAPKVCDHCSTTFNPSMAMKKIRYCSQRCNYNAWIKRTGYVKPWGGRSRKEAA